jgi:hypothetical protein
LSAAAGALLLQTVATGSAAEQRADDNKPKNRAVPRKAFGRTGIQISIFGFGGYHLGTVQSQLFGDRELCASARFNAFNVLTHFGVKQS